MKKLTSFFFTKCALFSLVLLISTGLVPLAAVDLGGNLSTLHNATFDLDDNIVGYSNESVAELWARFNIDQANYVSIRGNLTLEYLLDSDTIIFNGDLDELFIRLLFADKAAAGPSNLLVVGRSLFTDTSGVILSHKLDGIQNTLTIPLSQPGDFDVVFPSFVWKFSAGTSALLFNHSSGFLLNAADIANLLDDTKILAVPRLLLVNEFLFPRFAGGQTLALAGSAQIDLSQDIKQVGDLVADTTETSSRINSLYAGGHLKGKIAGPLFYEAGGYFQYASQITPVGGTYSIGNAYEQINTLAGMAYLNFSLFFPEAANLKIGIESILGGFDADATGSDASSNVSGDYSGFSTITPRGSSEILIPQLNNISESKLSLSIKPDENLRIALNSYFFARPYDAEAGGISGLVNGSQLYFLGYEADLKVDLRISSEWGLSFTYGFFAPSEAIDRNNEMLLKLELNLGL